MKILGLSAFYHDSAAAILVGGHIVAAAQEERFTRKKFDAGFPVEAIKFCLHQAGCRLRDIDFVVFHDKPLRKFERLLHTYAAFAPQGFGSFRHAIPLWLKGKLFQKVALVKALAGVDPAANMNGKLLFAEHHQSHAASAFYPSPFDEAVVLTMDGVGEWATTSVAIGSGNGLRVEKEIRFPHSLGLLYAAVTQYLGFKVLSGEYKVMGLAPYGTARYRDLIMERLIDVKSDGTFHLDQDYFGYCAGQSMTSEKFSDLFGRPARRPGSEQLEQFHMDLAASVQSVTEEVMLRLCRGLAMQYGIRNLCLAGGVALNCVANAKIRGDGSFDNIWIQPAAGDAGCALGAALAGWHQHLEMPRKPNGREDAMQGSLLGPAFAQGDIEDRLTKTGAVFDVHGGDDIIDETVRALTGQAAVGWFQGRMEFGPRALGGRSILGDARDPEMQKRMNLKIKFRESFRPFAPSVLAEQVSEWFDIDRESPYMLLVAEVAKKHQIPMTEEQEKLFGIEKLNVPRSKIPAATHVDYSARIQTVHRETNPRYYDLINEFFKLTGCPVVVNTSFNVRGEPIVCTPEDAYRCFMRSDIDVLVVDQWIFMKEDQPVVEDDRKWMQEFELD